MAATRTIRSPRSFRQWAAIAAIAAALERRVWTVTDAPTPLYPNLYTIFGGAPASGKSIAVGLARKMLAGIRGLYIGPDNPTPASFLDSLEASAKTAKNGSGAIIHSAMTILCREFGVLIPKYNEAFFADLSDLYDCGETYTSPRRTTKSIQIENPAVNLLAAATPAALGSLPEAAWGEGFTSRVVFIYGLKPSGARQMFTPPKDLDLARLQKRLEEVFNDVHGEMLWEPAAQDAMHTWYNDENMEPIPTYGRLVNYAGRREVHTMKLAMISSVSAGNGLQVTLADFNRAKSWLLDAEANMPDVFRAMMQKSDTQLLQDAHHAMYMEYSKVGRKTRKPIQEAFLYKFFEEKTTSDRIPGLIQQMERSGRMRIAGFKGEWIPSPLDGRIDPT